MNRSEVLGILYMAKQYDDRQTCDEGRVQAWQVALNPEMGLEFAAEFVVKFYSSQPDKKLMPAHLNDAYKVAFPKNVWKGLQPFEASSGGSGALAKRQGIVEGIQELNTCKAVVAHAPYDHVLWMREQYHQWHQKPVRQQKVDLPTDRM